MALVQIFNDAAQAGAGAMRACIAQHGDPVVLEDGVVLPRQRRDLSYLGFAVHQGGSGGEDTDSDFGDDDAPASFTHATFCQPVVPGANALLAGAEPPQQQRAVSGAWTIADEADRLEATREAIRLQKD